MPSEHLLPVEHLQLGVGDVDGFIVDDPGHRLPAPGVGCTALIVSKLFNSLFLFLSLSLSGSGSE